MAEQALFEYVATDLQIISPDPAVEVVRADVLFVNVRPAAGADDEISATLAAFQQPAEQIGPRQRAT
jgi:hypothetical protein